MRRLESQRRYSLLAAAQAFGESDPRAALQYARDAVALAEERGATKGSATEVAKTQGELTIALFRAEGCAAAFSSAFAGSPRASRERRDITETAAGMDPHCGALWQAGWMFGIAGTDGKSRSTP